MSRRKKGKGTGKGKSAPGGGGAAIGSGPAARTAFRPDRRLVLRSAGAAGVLLAGGYALHRHDTANRHLHDLAAIGDGAPVVVQIHDPACPLCRRLKSATEKALEGNPHVRYRLADVTRPEGRELQERHGVPTVTLVLFDGRGRRVDTVSGVQSVETLEAVFAERFGERAAGEAKTPAPAG